jgi:hypothetical protein
MTGFTKISMAKKMAMTAAVKALEETQRSTISTLKADRFLADAHWDVVLLLSEIKNPYANRVQYRVLDIRLFVLSSPSTNFNFIRT